MKIIFIIILVLCISTYQGISFDKDSLFSKYLKKYHKIYLDTTQQVFIFINLRDCGHCVRTQVDALKNNLIRDDVYMIFSFTGRKKPKILVDFKDKKNVYYDKKNVFFSLNISPFSNAVIITKNKIIKKIISINTENIDKYIDKINKNKLE